MQAVPKILDGITVVDLTSNLAGPTATMILATLGASVTKVERPGGEDARSFTPAAHGRGIMFDWANRGKRSVIVDLRSRTGCEILTRLIAGADVVIHSFRPGVMEKLGFAAERVREINPDVIYADVNAFGVGTEGAPSVGYDALVQGFTGVMLANGAEGDPPIRTAPSTIDVGTGQWMAMGILVALMAKKDGHAVQRLEATLYDTAMAFMPDKAVDSYLTGESPGRQGSGNIMSVPYAAFRCRDGHVFIAAPNERLWRRLAEALGLAHLVKDPRFSTLAGRVAHLNEMAHALEAVLIQRDSAEWIDILEEAGVPAGPVNTLAQAVHSQVAKARRTFTDDRIPAVRLPITIDGEPMGPLGRSPEAGEHTRQILRELGFSSDEACEFETEGSVECA